MTQAKKQKATPNGKASEVKAQAAPKAKPVLKAVPKDTGSKPMFAISALFKTDAEAEKASISLAKRANGVFRDYQRVACSYILHIGQHGDVRPLNRFVESLKDVQGMRLDAMQAFFVAFGNVTLETDADGKFTGFSYVKGGAVKLGEALSKPWWTMTKQKDYVPFVLLDALQALIERATKKAAQPKEGDTVNEAHIAKLQKLASELRKAEKASPKDKGRDVLSDISEEQAA